MAEALPDNMANMALAITATLAGPPENLPTSITAISMNVLPPPVVRSIAPKATNRAIKVAELPVRNHHIEEVEKYIWVRTNLHFMHLVPHPH